MPGKHHQGSVASQRRYPIMCAVVLLCIAVAGVFAAVDNRRDPGTPLFVVPAVTTPPSEVPSPSAAPASTSPSASPSPSRSASRPPSPSPSRSASRPPSPSPSRSPSRPPSPERSSACRSPNAARSAFTASYTVLRSRRRWFQAAISVTNAGRAARTWEVVVTHDRSAGVRLKGTVGARATTSGDTITFRGGPLGPGDSVTFRYRAWKRTKDVVEPTSCRVNGVECRVTVARSGG